MVMWVTDRFKRDKLFWAFEADWVGLAPRWNKLALRKKLLWFPISKRSYGRTDRQANMARSNRLVILIKNICTSEGRKRILLPVTYFPTNLIYPFTLRLTGIISNKQIKEKNWIACLSETLYFLHAYLHLPRTPFSWVMRE